MSRHTLSKTELTGLILLGILVAAITASAILLRDCSGQSSLQQGPEVKIEIVDTVAAPAPTKETTKKKEKKKRGASGRKKKAPSKKKTPTVNPKNPFTDTIPTY